MNSTTNAVTGSLTRHTMTAGGVAGLISAQDDIIRLLSLVITVIGLGWSIWEKLTAKRVGSGGGDAAGLFCVAGVSAAMVLLGGCQSRPLDPAGPYRGDAVLYHADGVIIQVAEVYQTFAGLAARNPGVVANSATIRGLVEWVERELDGEPRPDELLAQMIAARDAYAAAPTAENATKLQGALSKGRAMLEHVRTLLPALVAPGD
jgi:hypothetical protein